MADVLILIPARMASTRLPGKPLADIAGEPMIVHVMRRAQAAQLGPVVVATDSEAIAACVEKAGGRAVMTRADHVSGSDRIFEALDAADPERRAGIIVNVQGDLPTLAPADIAAALVPLADPAVDIATLAAEISRPDERTNPNVVKVVGTPVAPSAGCARSISPAPPRRPARGRSITISASTPIAARRSPASSRFRPRRSNGARSSSSCARSKPACASTWPSSTACRSASTRPRTWSARVRCSRHFTIRTAQDVHSKGAADCEPVDLDGRRAYRNGHDGTKKIVFQGEPGANSHLASREVYPDYEAVPCATFEDAFAAISTGEAELGMIPIENSVAGRVADIHHLMPHSGLHIVAEHFMPVRHQLLAPRGATLEDIKTVESHVHALGQCRKVIRKLGIKPVVAADTAGSAREIAEANDKTRAAIATRLAAEIYGLDILAQDIEDEAHNTTRFIVLSRDARWAKSGDGPVVTTFLFRVRNVPAALYKALGGFATNGVNMTKLESYMIEGNFFATQFYADVEGHPEQRNLVFAFEELAFYSKEMKILGVYPAHPFRATFEESID